MTDYRDLEQQARTTMGEFSLVTDLCDAISDLRTRLDNAEYRLNDVVSTKQYVALQHENAALSERCKDYRWSIEILRSKRLEDTKVNRRIEEKLREVVVAGDKLEDVVAVTYGPTIEWQDVTKGLRS